MSHPSPHRSHRPSPSPAAGPAVGSRRASGRRVGRALGLLAAVVTALPLVLGGPVEASGGDRTAPPGGDTRLSDSQRPMPIGSDRFRASRPYTGDFPDPTLLRVGRTWYAYATTIASLNLPVMTSTDLKTWRARPAASPGQWWAADAMPRAAAWAETRRLDGGRFFSTTWAPSVARVGTTYLSAYATPHRSRLPRTMCVSIATARSPLGPFVDRTTAPLVCPRGEGAIDPQIYLAPGGGRWLLWKTEGIPEVRPTRLWVRRLDGSARHFLRGSHPVLLLRTQEAWEGRVLENPAMIRVGGRYYLFYSAGSWFNETYSTGYAVCETVTGPCRRGGSGPLLATGGAVAGPGGAMPFRDERGRLRLAYAAWSLGATGYPATTACLTEVGGCPQRRLHVARLWARADGDLVVVERG